MFVDLIKGRKAAQPQKRMSADNDRDEMSDERLDEIMAELFGSADDEERDERPAPKRKVKKGARAMLEKAMEEDDFDIEDDDDEDMEKGMSRREMMNQVYSMVDDLSDEELDSFLSDRQIKKAQVMAIFEQMPTSDLKELVSAREANGAEPMSPLAMKGAGGYNYDMEKADEDEDLDLEDEI
jgi:hypothetical protein